jgi:hypothetical protein
VIVGTVLKSFDGSVGDNSATERERLDDFIFFSFAMK